MNFEGVILIIPFLVHITLHNTNHAALKALEVTHLCSGFCLMASFSSFCIRYILPTSYFLLCFQLLGSEASIHFYRNARFAGNGNAFVLYGGSEGLYASLSPTQHNGSSGSENSFIRFESISFRRPQGSAASTRESDSMTVQALIFEVEDRENVGGSAYGGQRAVCCTPDLAKLGVCIQDTIIYRPSPRDPGWPKVFGVAFKGNELTATLPSRTIEITRTGMYNLYFIHCDPRLNGIVVDGKTIWKNPDGYLPGRMSPLMNFYGMMSLAFVMLAIYWFSQYAKFWKEVLPLQNCITVVLMLGASEMSLWYFEFARFNEQGIRPIGFTTLVITIATIKRTVSRILILVVSMGYGVVRPTLGGLTSKVIMLGATFFLASEVLELVENVGAISDFSGKARLFLVVPVALLDAFFIVWIFTSLSYTLDKLQARRLTAKLDVYRKFANCLAVAVVVSVGWICYELYFKTTDTYSQRWLNAWIIPAFWQVLAFSLLCIICALWAPSQNSMRYAYSSDAGEDFDSEDTLLLSNPGPSNSSGSHGSSSEYKVTKKIEIASPLHVDLEEDKRE